MGSSNFEIKYDCSGFGTIFARFVLWLILLKIKIGWEMIKKAKNIFIVAIFILGIAGTSQAASYYESYQGWQYVSQTTRDYLFHFDIELADNGRTNSSLDFIDDAVGFDWRNNEQLDFVQIQLDLFSTDFEPELFDLDVNIYWSGADFSETVSFNVNNVNGMFYYTYDFTEAQIDGWEVGGWGSLTIDAYDIAGCGNFNDFAIKRVGLEAGTEAAPVPEPSTVVLLGAGLLGLVGYNRKRLHGNK